MRQTWLANAAVAALLLGAATAGTAQAQDRDRGGADRSPGGEVREAPRAAPERSVQPSRPQVEQRSMERAPQRPSAERPQQREPVQRAEPRERERQAPQRVEKRPEQKSTPKQAAPKNESTPSRAARSKDSPGQVKREQIIREQASNEQRGRVRGEIFGQKGIEHISRRDFGASIVVGGHVNRRHHLYRLTPAIVGFAPFYSGYSYIVVDDTICIVDPVTYVIVDIIPASMEYAQGSSHRPQLALSADQMHFIYASVPKDNVADVRVRLALGAEVPAPVALERFPDGVIDHVPQIEAFRYIVVGDDVVVVVDPSDRSVALVITE